MEIIRATEDDIRNFDYDGIESETLEAYDWRARIQQYFVVGPAWIAVHNDKAIAVGGYFGISKGVAQAWLLFNKDAAKFARSIALGIKNLFENAMREEGIHRIQTFTPEASKQAERYVELMGFEKESDMVAFGPNRENVSVFRMIKK